MKVQVTIEVTDRQRVALGADGETRATVADMKDQFGEVVARFIWQAEREYLKQQYEGLEEEAAE